VIIRTSVWVALGSHPGNRVSCVTAVIKSFSWSRGVGDFHPAPRISP
jgi:hypothetical protein